MSEELSMISLFQKRVDTFNSIWFVVPGAVIKGTNLRTKELDNKIHTVELSDVTIQVGVGHRRRDL